MPTIFTRIINRELPGDIVYEDEHCIAFKDINPAAPVHILVVPKKEIPRLADATEEDQALLGHLMLTVGKVARQLGVDDAFKVAIANGRDAGQTVFHLHVHLMAGRRYSEKEAIGS
jgi:histidine triad (HIT) family protein